jgi:5,10-methenyltetrahydrofolate synthetase
MTRESAPDPQQATEVARWRKAERMRLIAERIAVDADTRSALAAKIARDLDGIVDRGPGTVVSLYWPFRGEPDLRGWMRSAHDSGRRVALPVVTEKGRPLTFRLWEPGAPMERGIWNIPVPAKGGEVIPTVTIAPLVGFDAACFRLGYGGGYFDRTLASLESRPTVIGVGYAFAAIATIRPQPHDIPMDWIVTGDGSPRKRA